jgi:hypothetical protein
MYAVLSNMTKINTLPGYTYMPDPWLVDIIHKSGCAYKQQTM